MTKSVLEEIPGIGPSRRKELLKHFKDIDSIKRASYEDLLACDTINSKVAESIIEYFSRK